MVIVVGREFMRAVIVGDKEEVRALCWMDSSFNGF